jgi:hypothetical protein
VQRLQVARRELALESAINRLDRFDLVILDDFAYVSKGCRSTGRASRSLLLALQGSTATVAFDVQFKGTAAHSVRSMPC